MSIEIARSGFRQSDGWPSHMGAVPVIEPHVPYFFMQTKGQSSGWSDGFLPQMSLSSAASL